MELSHHLYVLLLAGGGVLVLLTAWLPMLLRRAPLSLPILCVGAGATLFALPPLRPFAVHPLQFPILVERLSELVVIISLMGAGLKIDRMIGLRSWMLTWRLLGIAMPVTMVIVAGLALGLLGLGLAAALLIAAVLAPTDPVLASDVQVGGPGEGKALDEAVLRRLPRRDVVPLDACIARPGKHRVSTDSPLPHLLGLLPDTDDPLSRELLPLYLSVHSLEPGSSSNWGK